MPTYTDTHDFMQKLYFCENHGVSVVGFYDRQGDVKNSPYGAIKKRGFEGVYSFTRFAFVRTHACLANYSKCTYNAKSVYGKNSIRDLYRKSPINTLGDFLNLWRAQLLISPFWVKNQEMNCVLRSIFYGSLTSDFFVIFTFEIFF